MPHTLHEVLPHHEFALEEVRTLFKDYQRDIGVDLCFQGFAEEVASLPGKYLGPEGVLFLLRVGNVPAGCVAIRRLEEGACELKRLYVTPDFRGTGLGTWLLDLALEKAKNLGYRTIRLDTLSTMGQPQAMYRRRGFVECQPYNDSGGVNVCYMELDLSRQPGRREGHAYPYQLLK